MYETYGTSNTDLFRNFNCDWRQPLVLRFNFEFVTNWNGFICVFAYYGRLFTRMSDIRIFRNNVALNKNCMVKSSILLPRKNWVKKNSTLSKINVKLSHVSFIELYCLFSSFYDLFYNFFLRIKILHKRSFYVASLKWPGMTELLQYSPQMVSFYKCNMPRRQWRGVPQ